ERQRFETTLSSIADGVIATDTEGDITFMNAAAEALTGWKWEDASGRHVTTVFQIIDEITDVRLIGKDGNKIPIEKRGSTIQDSEGQNLGAVLIFRDISERKRIEDERRAFMSDIRKTQSHLLESQGRLERALRGAGLGTWDWNAKTDEVIFNAR